MMIEMSWECVKSWAHGSHTIQEAKTLSSSPKIVISWIQTYHLSRRSTSCSSLWQPKVLKASSQCTQMPSMSTSSSRWRPICSEGQTWCGQEYSQCRVQISKQTRQLWFMPIKSWLNATLALFREKKTKERQGKTIMIRNKMNKKRKISKIRLMRRVNKLKVPGLLAMKMDLKHKLKLKS